MTIQCQEISKSYGTLDVLRSVSFEIESGEITAILGRSGAGKTTLLQILSTLLTPDSGSVLFGTTDVTKLRGDKLYDFRARNIGFVFQSHHLLPEFTAIENIMLAGHIAGGEKSEVESRARELLDMMSLSQRADHKPSALSGGEAQRVAVARALINRPAVVFADEPSGNLDRVSRDALYELFFRLRGQMGQTFVVVTHDEALASMCDRKITITSGEIVQNA